MISLLGSITMVSIAAYFFMACLFLLTEKRTKRKNKAIILSFIAWTIGGLCFIYAGSYAELHGLLALATLVETFFSVTSLILLGKVLFSSPEHQTTNQPQLND